MPTDLRVVQVDSLSKFVEEVERLSADKTLWYRGSHDTNHALIPSLYRHPGKLKIDELLKLEADILARFMQRSIPYQTRQLDEGWESFFFMQHFGIPTRLLDWTESPFVGLYFALTSVTQTYGLLRDNPASPTIWVLDPVAWNRKVLDHMNYQREVLSANEPELNGYWPPDQVMNTLPVAMYGMYNSPRIVAQRGVFTIFGKSLEAMEAAYQNGDFPPDSLIKLVIPADAVVPMLKKLVSIGITDSVVCPDLFGLAKEIKRHFGFIE